MKSQRIELIPVSQIRVVNPRSRNQVTFKGIVTNIGAVGLKKPITVFRRKMEADGTQYDLVCGQGRLEAVIALGGASVPSIVTNAPLRQRYLMSLIENVARKRPSSREFLNEIRAMKSGGQDEAQIAAKLGMGREYVAGVLILLERGEDKLVAQVERGTLPLSVAVKIATTSGDHVQRALSEAYTSGELRGERLRTIQRLIVKRTARARAQTETKSLVLPRTARDLVKEYERHTQRQRTLVRRAAVVSERLIALTTALKRLLEDSQFLGLLRDEGLDVLPEPLAKRLGGSGGF